MTSTKITCPSCHTQFEPTDALREQLQNDLRRQMQDWKAQQVKDFEQKEREFSMAKEQQEKAFRQQLETQRQELSAQIAKEQETKLNEKFETQIRHLNQTNLDNEARLKEARQKELEFLKKEQDFKNKEEELEIRKQQELLEARKELSLQVRKEEEEKSKLKEQEFQFKIKEKEQQLEQQMKLVEEMKRKAEQGSMQLQGEVQELLLEAMLRQRFPFDLIEEVGKGVRGGDCVHIVRNQFGQECGKIVYESKRTNAFSNDWIEKVKADMRSKNADIAVIVTQALPKDVTSFGLKDGVWICSYKEAGTLALMLREQILKVYQVMQNSENKTDKMSLLYGYLTSNEFSEQWKAIREGFQSMKSSIQKERDAMEKLWKAREKQLEKILLNAAHIKGSVEGISGSTNIDFDLIEGDDMLLIE
ncbi:MAG TPA: DUF2130 domain-containing protein [Chitinophagaceae bacterium]|nr:DUF2130 domain-containing protein [Chitinophagaceae bacterium]